MGMRFRGGEHKSSGSGYIFIVAIVVLFGLLYSDHQALATGARGGDTEPDPAGDGSADAGMYATVTAIEDQEVVPGRSRRERPLPRRAIMDVVPDPSQTTPDGAEERSDGAREPDETEDGAAGRLSHPRPRRPQR